MHYFCILNPQKKVRKVMTSAPEVCTNATKLHIIIFI